MSWQTRQNVTAIRKMSQQASSSSSLLNACIPFPYLVSIPNVYYWKKAFNHIVGTLYISFDFIYFDGKQSTINPMIKIPTKKWSFSSLNNNSTTPPPPSPSENSSSEGTPSTNNNNNCTSSNTTESNDFSCIVLYEHLNSVNRENYLLKPCLCMKTNLNEGEKHYFYGLESITNTISIIEHASFLSLTSQLSTKLIAIKQERPEVKSHSLNTNSSKRKKSDSSTPSPLYNRSVRDQIEYEKDQMIKLAKKTKEINQDTLYELNYQHNELKDTKENYLEPIKAYNSLGSRLLTGMSWGGFVKNLWSYSKWKKIEKETLIFRDDSNKQRSLDFNSHTFDILLKDSEEKHCRYYSDLENLINIS